MLSRKIRISHEHRIAFTRGAFRLDNPVLSGLLPPARPGQHRKTLAIVDAGLARANPQLATEIEQYTNVHGLRLVTPPVIFEGGEPAKNSWRHVEEIYELIDRHRICRHSYVLAIGGGALLDLVGFAAATAHRGIRLIRFPATTLSQADGGIGVKNGINFFGKKNFVGTFSVPYAVINDLDFLETLPPAQQRSGLIEAVKVALIKDQAFFEWIEANAAGLQAFARDPVEKVVRRSAELHLDHIAGGGDPFEQTSARPLDFGHWAGHKLEQISGFRLNHGEAVAIGLALDVTYSRRAGLLGTGACERILQLVERLGFELFDPALTARSPQGSWLVLDGLEEFREHLGGELTVTLLTDIGTAADVHAMDRDLILASIRELHERATAAPAAACSGP